MENKWHDDGMPVDSSDVTAFTQKWPKKVGDLPNKARKLQVVRPVLESWLWLIKTGQTTVFGSICGKINKKWKPGGPHIPEMEQFDWL